MTQLAHQSADNLIFGLSFGRPPPIAYQVLARRTFAGPLPMEAHIVGQSHLIRYETREGPFFETLACVDRRELSGFRHFSLADRPTLEVVERFAGFVYRVRVLKEPLTPSSWLEAEQFMGHKSVFSHLFPVSRGCLHQPVTALSCEPEKGRVRTLHVYPEEGRLVWSDASLQVD